MMIVMRTFLTLILIFTGFLSEAQKILIPKNRIPVHQADFFAWVEVYDGEIKTSSLENNKTYYWIKAKQIHTSKGGYYGELLHGEYTALYKTDALKEKGKYSKGLKTGEWKEWHPNGELLCISHWKNGLPKGSFCYYNTSGKITRREWYKNGLLHGKQMTYTDSIETITKYRKGKAVQTKTPKAKKTFNKKEKIKIEPGQEIPVVKDTSVSPQPQKEKKKFFRLKKENTPPEQEKEKKDEPEREKKKKKKQNTGNDTKG